MIIEHDHQEQEDLFVNQAAHLLLALAGIKPLPKQKSNLNDTLEATDLSNL